MQVIHPDLVKEKAAPALREIIDSQIGDDWARKLGMDKALKDNSSHFLTIAFPDSTQKSPPIRVYHTPVPGVHTDEENWATDEDIPRKVVVSEPAGVCIAGKFDSPSLASYFNFSPDEYPPILGQADPPIGVIECVAVHKLAKQNSIGTELVRRTVDLLEAGGCHTQTGIGWKEVGNEPVYRIMRKAGFSAIREFENYWFDESRHEGYKCYRCGPPPCDCTAVIYVRS